MSLIIFLPLAGVPIALFLYCYRWNVFHPLKKGRIVVGGSERTFLYHVPRHVKPHSKLVIVYHGSTRNAWMMQILTGHEFDLLADRDQDAIIVYPQGFKGYWNGCAPDTPVPAGQPAADDVGFTRQLIDFFIHDYAIDPGEVYAIGFSNGGQMVTRLANAQPGWFKGFAVISANLPAADHNQCKNVQQPVSLMYVSGMADPIVPYRGGVLVQNGRSFGNVESTVRSLEHWLQAAECAPIPHSVRKYPESRMKGAATAIRETYLSEGTGKQVSFVRIVDGGHTIPNANFRISSRSKGPMNRDIDLPAVIWEFFRGLDAVHTHHHHHSH